MILPQQPPPFDIQFGEKIGPYVLGKTINELIFDLKSRRPIPEFEIHYSDKHHCQRSIAIQVVSDGVRLFFNSRMQTLQLIDVYDVKKIPLVHQNVIFGGANDMAAATFGHLYELFGPTYGGKFNSDYDAYLLKYKAGLSILFPLPLEMQDQYRDGYAKNLNLPVEFPDGSTPVLKRLLLYRGSSHTKIDMVPCAVENYMERVQVRILDDERRGLYFTQRSCALDLGALPEEIMGKLGRPVDIYYKKVLSVSSETTTMGVSPRDYFLNYDHLGIDFLISGETNALVKIILHTNVVGHADFGTYLKCNFHLEMKHGKKKTDRSYIDPDMTWEKIVEEWVHLKDARPVIQNHNATSTTTTSLHPFGPTYYYTLFPGCVVEVLRNGNIASMTLFNQGTTGPPNICVAL